MSGNILVVYASKYGSTAGVGEAIAKELRIAGFDVDSSPVTERTQSEDLSPVKSYRAVVIGSPIYMGKLLVEARDFVKAHQHDLRERPVAVFTVGYSLKEKNDDHLRSANEAVGVLRDFIEPVAVGYFAGTYNPEVMSISDRLIMKLVGGVPGDYRDWDEIRVWARGLADLIPE